jgi:hypothetical protein
MKSIRSLILGLGLLIGLASTQSAHAYYYYNASGWCTKSPAFGALSLTRNYGTYSGAVSRARTILQNFGCYSFSIGWYNYTGYCGIGRGYNYDGSYVKVRRVWAWTTYSGAYNSIYNGLASYPYSKGILVGYNY